MTISVKDSGGSDKTINTIDDLISYGPALEAGGNLATIAGAISSSKMATKAASGDFADGAVATIGAKADTAVTATDTTPGSVVALLKGVISKLAGTLTVATHAVTQSGTWNVTNVSGTVSLPTGAATSANQTTGNTSLSTIAGAVSSSKVATKAASGDFADGALATIGTKADAASTATDTTAVTLMAVNKQISKSAQALAAVVKAASSGSPASTDPAIAVTVRDANSNGRALPAASAPVVLNSMTYKAVAASQTAALFGTTGATGDYLDHVLIIPATAAAGAVSITDGSGSAITIFAGGGTTALPTLAPFSVYVGAVSSGGSGGWKVTTGANVSVIGVGNFT